MRRSLRFLIWAVSIYLLLCTAVAFFLADVTVHPYRRALTAETKADVQKAAAELGAGLTEASIEAQNHATLRTWLIQPQRGNGNAVILLHGLGDNRQGMTGYAELLLAHGYTVLLPDSRAHGESGGNLATYGIIERDDIRRWFEWLDQARIPLAFMVSANPWERRSCCSLSQANRTSARWSPNLRSQVFARSPTTAWDSASALALG